jgi:endogenous inhibitor of DNA gyrase (YacG/DUF329 family)
LGAACVVLSRAAADEGARIDYRFPVRRKCPSCGRVIEATPLDPFRPFCSERCRMADLGKWLDGAYRISAPVTEEDLDQGLLPDNTDGDPKPS